MDIFTCTICNPTAGVCSRHRHWVATYATDDITSLRDDLRDGDIDFTEFEMVS